MFYITGYAEAAYWAQVALVPEYTLVLVLLVLVLVVLVLVLELILALEERGLWEEGSVGGDVRYHGLSGMAWGPTTQPSWPTVAQRPLLTHVGRALTGVNNHDIGLADSTMWPCGRLGCGAFWPFSWLGRDPGCA